MSIPIFQVDAFTDRPFSGNPAAVCLLDAPPDAAWMQAVAAEMNLSETAFLLPQDDGFNLRWFTPAVEVSLCGHATLASAHTLFETGALKPDQQAHFHTRSGLLTARRVDDQIELDFPARLDSPADPPDGLLDALGLSAVRYVGQSRSSYLIEVDSAQIVRGLAPDFSRLKTVSARGIMITASADAAPYDFVSRFFAPAVGVNEDPVTGSAHCCLGPFWQRKLGKNLLLGYQASARGGTIYVQVDGDRVRLRGRAVTVLRGELIASYGDLR
ncbi:MAG: PhzF family phenazine biosynthesis protein [Anaerolineae bacterium]|nr:PhzF family phenazine biosynthesis protein [Anaerolineae bacterium]